MIQDMIQRLVAILGTGRFFLTQILTQTGNFTEKCRAMVSKAARLPLRNTRMCDNMLIYSLELVFGGGT